VVRKGAPAVATVTEVVKPNALGEAGVVYFRVDYLDANGLRVKLHGSAGKRGRERAGSFARAFPIAGIFITGKDAEIKPGALFVATVGEDTPLPPANQEAGRSSATAFS